jgi:mRNA interferase MazF
VVSRQALLETSFSTVVCAPVYSNYHGIATQVPVRPEVGLKRTSAIHCDNLQSLPRTSLTDYVGRLSPGQLEELDEALRVAVDLR